MSPLWFMFGGIVWWVFFEWLRGRPRYRTVGTQDFCLMGLIGLVTSIGGTIAWLLHRLL